jgi:hypothetical protein
MHNLVNFETIELFDLKDVINCMTSVIQVNSQAKNNKLNRV